MTEFSPFTDNQTDNQTDNLRKEQSINFSFLTGSVKTGTKKMKEKGVSRREIEERVNQAIDQGWREAEEQEMPEEIKQIVDRLERKASKMEGLDEDKFCQRLDNLIATYRN